MLAQAALNYVGVPWAHRGRSGYGLDCIGLVVRCIQDCGGEVNDRHDYGMEPWKERLRHELESHLRPVNRDPKPNDIILLKWRQDTPPAHVGIVTDKGDRLGFVHSLNRGKREVIHTGLSPRHRRLIAGVYEWAQPDK